TFENIGIKRAPPFGAVEQVNLKYVNTDLATLTGTELLGTYALTDMLTPFANLQYVRGEDQTRNGRFATQPASIGAASERFDGLPRGSFSNLGSIGHSIGAAKEPLPQIIPLQSRVGLRLHEASMNPRWAVEVAARLVGPQNRVAVSLLEL